VSTAHDPKPEAFETLMGRLNYPMFVVTTTTEREKSGCLVGFATQASINPSRFLVGLSNKNHTYRVARDASFLAVHVLHRSDKRLASLFGEQTGDEINKFEYCDWLEGPEGLPILTDAAAWFYGRILLQNPLGDHVAFLIEPIGGGVEPAESPVLTFAEVSEFDAGHGA